MIRGHGFVFAVIIGLGILSTFAEGIGITLFIPLLSSIGEVGSSGFSDNPFLRAINDLFGGIAPGRRLLIVSACILLAIILKSLLTFTYGVLQGWLNNKIGHGLRSKAFNQVLTLSFDYLHSNKAANLWNTLATETWRTTSGISVLVGFIISLFTLFVYILLLLVISWKLTLAVGASMITISFVVRYLTRSVHNLGREATRINQVLAGRMLEGMAGNKVIRSYGREAYEQGRFDDASQKVSRTFFRLSALNAMIGPVYEVLTAVLLVAILISVVSTQQNLAAILVFIFLLYRLQPKIKALDSARLELRAVEPAVADVMSLLEYRDKRDIRSGNVVLPAFNHEISFENVAFRYLSSSEEALKNINLTIPKGKKTAVVGPSGSGKTTLVNLLLRFHEPSEGTIKVDGHRLVDLDINSWRRRISIVSQDIYLFNASVQDNIAYGKPDATLEEIVHAAKKADAHTFIEKLPKGYETILGDGDKQLSGGQKQRIALARAIVRRPEILILDEATNALDSISEDLIQQAINQLGYECTVIIIAHRLGTIARADQVVVLEEGEVREKGSIEELLERDGLFARLYHLHYANLVG